MAVITTATVVAVTIVVVVVVTIVVAVTIVVVVVVVVITIVIILLLPSYCRLVDIHYTVKKPYNTYNKRYHSPLLPPHRLH